LKSAPPHQWDILVAGSACALSVFASLQQDPYSANPSNSELSVALRNNPQFRREYFTDRPTRNIA
jgi:hypothetical protein